MGTGSRVLSPAEVVAGLEDGELPGYLEELAGVVRLAYSGMIAAITAMEERNIEALTGYRPNQVAELVREKTRLPRVECRKLVKVSRLTRERELGGSCFGEPLLAGTAAALEDGDLSPHHAKEIIDVMRQIPADWHERDHHEATLAQAARSAYPEDIKNLGRLILDRIEQETPPTETDEDLLAEPRRHLTLSDRGDGRLRFHGEVDGECAAEFKAILSSMSNPRSGPEGRDTRPITRRQGDALAEIIHHAANDGIAPVEGGVRPHIAITLSWEDLCSDLKKILIPGIGITSPKVARRMACDAGIIPVIMRTTEEPLSIGRAARTVPAAIRRALCIRDKGCAYPGCDRPAHWCDGHHVRWWSFSGETRLDNLVLLCLAHHQMIHHTGWNVVMKQGIPWFIPPDYIDPDQKPIRHARYSMTC
jgi:hypothetical protein